MHFLVFRNARLFTDPLAMYVTTSAAAATCQVEMDDGSGFRHVARAAERQCAVEGLRSGVLYK